MDTASAWTWWTPIPSRPRTPTTSLRVGRLLKAHGLKGALKLELYTDEPEHRFASGAVLGLQVPDDSPWHGKTVEVVELRWYNLQPVVFLKGIDDRTAAESLVKAILLIDKDDAELPAEQDAWYDHQLVGLTATRDGAPVGTVVRVDHFPAQDLLVIDTGSERGEVMVPFVKAIVPAVDLDAGTVTLTPPTGLFEAVVDDDGPEAGTPAELTGADAVAATAHADVESTDAEQAAETQTAKD